ncbi:MAG: LysM peptidoglycan-binding domain-containing protein [Anaerolineales bacterium]|nr:LysM peptidoglycan-binding domain-containing protein [Anaerolineales bacterium]
MSKKQRGMLVIFVFVISTMLVSACTQSLSSAPAATPTLIPDGLFVSPFPSVENPMAMIEEFAKQTAAAQTTVANGGTPVTPGAVVTATTPLAVVTGTLESGVIPTATSTAVVISTPTNAIAQPASTSVPVGARPASYTLQSGEFPYCIARRFNVDPDELLALSGLSSAQANSLSAGTVLKIPQSGAFPGSRVWHNHPDTYTVDSSSETIYGVACYYGDIDPNAIASANSISVSASLTAGQQLKIP